MLRFVTLCMLVAFAAAMKLKFTDCGHNEVISLDVVQCTTDPCKLKKGNVTGTVVFTANQDTKTLTLVVLAKLGSLEIQVPGIESDGCKYVQCPLVKGKVYEATANIPIPSLIPSGSEGDLTAKVTGDQGLVACGTVHASLID